MYNIILSFQICLHTIKWQDLPKVGQALWTLLGCADSQTFQRP